MLELARAAFRFPLAMSAFGMRQFLNAAQPGRAGAASYRVQQAAEDQLNDLFWAGFQVGDQLQRQFVDFVLDAATLRAFTPQYVGRVSAEIADQTVETIRTLTPGGGLNLAWTQLRNNYEVYNLVKQVHSILHIPSSGAFPLSDLIERAYALGQYPDLWAIEGLGHDYTDTFWSRGGPIIGVLTNPDADRIPDQALTMMHAGLGLSFAQKLVPNLTPYSPPCELRKTLERFLNLVNQNSKPGYAGAAYESLGLVTRTWHPRLMKLVDRGLRDIFPRADEYFWHGAGRALYFLPFYFVPGFTSPWRAADDEATDELARLNMRAGLTWATALVNVRQPDILANLLRYHGPEMTRDDSFTNGVVSTLSMASDITPHDVYVKAFIEYQPSGSDNRLRDIWNRYVRGPCHQGLAVGYPALKAANRLEELFRYRPLSQVMSGT
jgi:hypothetical protein